MKRKAAALLALLLSLVMLCSPALAGEAAESFQGDGAKALCRFADMPYERPDPAAIEAAAARLEDALEKGTSYRNLIRLLEECYNLYNEADTMLSIADIRNCLDLRDRRWAAEYSACLSASTEIQSAMERVFFLCGSSEYGARLEQDFFWEGFLEEYGPEGESMLTEEYLALAGEENELLARYRELVADPVVQLGLKERSVSEALDGARSSREFNRILTAYYDKYNPLLGELFLELTEVRKEQARVLGYESVAEMMYDVGYERDYTPEEGSAFIASLRTHLVPLYRASDADERYDELTEDYVGEEELEELLDSVSEGIGGDAGELWQFMRRYELFDFSMSGKKADMSFQTYLSDYEVPYLFMSPYGDLSDLITATHEFGHCLEAYASWDAYRSVDLAEVFSQSMQFLALDKLPESFSAQEREELRELNLLDTLDTFVQQSSFAEFEERAYRMEKPSVEALNALSLELAKDYGYYDGESDDYYAMSWIDIPHFFEQPFYVISYPVSAGAALELYERELNQKGAGMALFDELVSSEHPGIVSAVTEAGMKDPLGQNRAEELAAFLKAQMNTRRGWSAWK